MLIVSLGLGLYTNGWGWRTWTFLVLGILIITLANLPR